MCERGRLGKGGSREEVRMSRERSVGKDGGTGRVSEEEHF